MHEPELTEEQGLRAYAHAMNALDLSPLREILAEDFHYASQMVLSELASKAEFLEYLAGKLETLRKSPGQVFAEMGTVYAYRGKQPCVILAQPAKEDLVAIVLARVAGGKLVRLDLCVVPPPQSATRSGEYPGLTTGSFPPVG